jgi:hypothetical protein
MDGAVAGRRGAYQMLQIGHLSGMLGVQTGSYVLTYTLPQMYTSMFTNHCMYFFPRNHDESPCLAGGEKLP